jgi:hypothetical protein
MPIPSASNPKLARMKTIRRPLVCFMLDSFRSS